MLRDGKAPAGPRPAVSRSPVRSKENISPVSKPTIIAPNADGPMLHASSSNNHSLFSFGHNGATTDVEDTSGAFDFLPSVSFDDLQSSLETASTEFKLTQFPSPTGQGSILEEREREKQREIEAEAEQPDKPLIDMMAGQQPNVAQHGGTTRVAIQPNPSPAAATRPSRNGSILRRPSTSNRQASAGSNAPAASISISDAPTAPAAMRNRRQSHYPPVSNTGVGKAPRKSIGPGIIDADYGNRTTNRRRPSLMSNASDKPAGDGARASLDFMNGTNGDNTRNLTVTRTQKAKSVQPPPRIVSNLNSSTSSHNTITPDGSRMSTTFPRSPRAGGKGSTPASAKRMSVLPGSHGSHATGLGARTISPTDAQRMKRMSMHQSQSLSQVANAPMPSDGRPNSRSPSMIPRKTSTPSSSRTTPDINRKSYSSGLSVGSSTSFNTHRTSTGSIQRANNQGVANSRLPAPKTLNISKPAPAEEEEDDVPPVPAIPKVYESPKESPATAELADLPLLDRRKSNYAFDTSSIHSSSTGTLSNAPVPEPTKAQRKPSTRKASSRSTTFGIPSAEFDPKATPTQAKKNLQPLRLPPINLGPLSTPTAAKIAALKDNELLSDGLSPPPSRMTAKTPTTPLTASKSAFFSRARTDQDGEKPSLRSSSSVHHLRDESPNLADQTSSSESLPSVPIKTQTRNPTVSPFLSSSVPQNEDIFGMNLTKSKTNSDVNNTIAIDTTSFAAVSQKPIGPRAPAPAKQPASKSPPSLPSPDAPPTPSSMSSLRRKLSLSWKRSNSKSSLHLPPTNSDKPPEGIKHTRQESMPPPRIPVSATGNLGSLKGPSPSHASKPSGSYLESRRRKSSASSLNAVIAQPSPKKDVGNASMIETSTQLRHPPSVQRMLRTRPSTASIKQELYSAELDKDDLIAEEEMKKLAMRRKETELAARTLDALRKRATPKERVGPQEAIRIAVLNIYEKGEIVDYSDIYFCGTQNAHKVVGDLHSDVPNFGYDDERGDYSIVVGDHLAYRYEIVDVLGKGSFGQVVRCIDHKTGALVAVKIIRNKKRFHQQALVEVNILQKLREWDPKNKHSMVNFTHSFYFRGHLCISTELLDMNLYEFIKSNSFRGFSLKLIRRFTKQMLSSLNLLKQHKVIHCDLKPENILVRHPMHSEIKVIDFGSSCFENEKVYTYIQSRFYRSPEVILGMTYGMPIDMWSLGCILAELYTGVPIFPGENEQEQLACIMEVFGPPEKHLIEKSTRKKLFFDSMGKPRLTVSSKGRRRRPSSKTLQQVLKCDDEAFLDFLARCLRWDPDRRLKPDEAIRHEFITGQKTSVPIPRAATRDSSPIKRHNTISTPRPLPDPPGVGKGGPGLRPREATGVSPIKPIGGARRTSAIAGPTTGTGTGLAAGTKRTSNGQSSSASNSLGSSNLPRVAGRSVSAKQDLASAGATAAMSRRA